MAETSNERCSREPPRHAIESCLECQRREIERLRALLRKAEEWVNVPMQASDAAGLRQELLDAAGSPGETNCGHVGAWTVLACQRCGVVLETPNGLTGAARLALGAVETPAGICKDRDCCFYGKQIPDDCDCKPTDETVEMARIGRAFMERLPKDYYYSDSPAEIITELQNRVYDLEQELKERPAVKAGGGHTMTQPEREAMDRALWRSVKSVDDGSEKAYSIRCDHCGHEERVSAHGHDGVEYTLPPSGGWSLIRGRKLCPKCSALNGSGSTP